MSFWGELKRRNVVRVGIAYVVVAWLLLQVSATLFPALQLPVWTVTFVAALLLLGFPIAVALSWAYEITPDGVRRSREVPSAASITRTTGRKIDRIIIVVLGLAIVFLVLDNYVLEESSPGGTNLEAARPSPNVVPAGNTSADTNPNAGAASPGVTNAAPAEPAAAARLRDSVAVLPFTNLSPDEEDAYFAIGLHDEILNQLSKLSNLNVISRTSMMRYANTTLSVPEIARELSVETVMEGTVRYAGNRIRVTMQLIDAASDNHLWSDTYERPFDDIFAIESDIAMSVANALQAEFSEAEQAAIEREPTSSPAAYALYLRAGDALFSGGGIRAALELLDRALEIDPSFADAIAFYAQLRAASLANTAQGTGVTANEREALEREVRALAARALEIDPANRDARRALIQLNVPTWRWSAFLDAQDVILDWGLGPGLWVYAWAGRIDDALRIGQRILALNPNLAGPHLIHGIVQAYAGDRIGANRTLQRAAELEPANSLTHAWLGYNHVALGDAESALAELQLVERLLGNNRQIVFLPELAYGYSRLGRTEDVERLVDEIEAIENPDLLGAGAWATVYLAVGDEQRALEQLEIVAEKARNHEPDAGYLNALNLKMNYQVDPRLEQPEFVDVLSRITGD